jgi:hypothetical protein
VAQIVEVDPNKKYVLVGNWNADESLKIWEIWKSARELIIINGNDVVLVSAEQVVGYKTFDEGEENG